MNIFVLKKWVEPYKLLEFFNNEFQCVDFTFNGLNKIEQKNRFLTSLDEYDFALGVYMKNVNKFYLFHKNENFDTIENLINEFNLSSADYSMSEDVDGSLGLIDLGKAEAVVIIP